MVLITIVNWVYKPTYNWGAPHHIVGVISPRSPNILLYPIKWFVRVGISAETMRTGQKASLAQQKGKKNIPHPIQIRYVHRKSTCRKPLQSIHCNTWGG